MYVADASENFEPDNPKWEHAGTWYLSGSNTYIYSPADGELGERKYDVKTSNRRFRDDEFLILAKLTRNRSALRIRVEHVPVERDLYPGQPFPRKSAWSELAYEVHSYVMPEFEVE